MKKNIFFIVIFLVSIVNSGYSEYYKYKDDSGVMHYTNDLSSVPEKKRENAVIIKGVKKDSSFQESGRTTVNTYSAFDYQIKSQAEKLDSIHNELEKMRKKIISEKKQINSKFRGKLSDKEEEQYISAVKKINNKIRNYEKKREDYEKQLKSFKSQL